jgi:hypothetical protein
MEGYTDQETLSLFDTEKGFLGPVIGNEEDHGFDRLEDAGEDDGSGIDPADVFWEQVVAGAEKARQEAAESQLKNSDSGEELDAGEDGREGLLVGDEAMDENLDTNEKAHESESVEDSRTEDDGRSTDANEASGNAEAGAGEHGAPVLFGQEVSEQNYDAN